MLECWEAIEDHTELLEQHPPHLVAMQKAWLLWRTFLVEGTSNTTFTFDTTFLYTFKMR